MLKWSILRLSTLDSRLSNIMTFSYTSRKRKAWYLFEGRTKLGKPRYFLTQETSNASATRLDAVPAGYEVFEKPNGQVFCRKHLAVLISDEEVLLVEKELAKRQLKNCVVERKGKDLIVHEGQGMELSGGLAMLFLGRPKEFEQLQETSRHYMPVLQFRLSDKEKRLFALSRWCFRGSIDGWIFLAEGKLPELAKKFVRHIGKESFYELY